jgi:hypothetical protein
LHCCNRKCTVQLAKQCTSWCQHHYARVTI